MFSHIKLNFLQSDLDYVNGKMRIIYSIFLILQVA